VAGPADAWLLDAYWPPYPAWAGERVEYSPGNRPKMHVLWSKLRRRILRDSRSEDHDAEEEDEKKPKRLAAHRHRI